VSSGEFWEIVEMLVVRLTATIIFSLFAIKEVYLFVVHR